MALRKAVKNIGMYRHDPKRFPGFIKPAQVALEAALKTGQVVLQVQAEAFVFDKETVWGSESGENIPGRFFREGVRQLVLRPGLTEPELNKLVTIMLSNPDRGGEEVLSQLFNGSFEHVSYAVAELFAFGDLSEGQLSFEVQKRIEEMEKRQTAATPRVKARAKAIAQGLDQKLEPMEAPQAPYVRAGDVALVYRQKVQEELKRDEGTRLYRELVSLVITQLKEGSLRDPAQAADVFAQLLDGMLQRSDLSPLGRLLGTLDEIKQGHVPVAEIKGFLAGRMSEEPRVRQLAMVLNAAEPDWMSCARYLAECKPGAAPVLLDMLPAIESVEARALVLETVAALDKDAGQVLSERLDTDGVHGVFNLISLAERLPPAERGKLVKQAITHPSAEIRLEAVRSLPRSTSPEAMQRFALEATTDGSVAVRSEAFRVLVKLSPRRAAQDLMRLPKLPDWDKRTMAEKELIFECLGRTDTDEALRYVLQLLSQPKKGLFGGKRVEMKLLAIKALSAMGNLQAFKTLQGVAAMPEQDPEATAAAGKGALRVRATMLQGEKAQTDAAAEMISAPAMAALEHVRKVFAARAPPAVTTPSAPGLPPPASLFTQPQAGPAATAVPNPESYESLDDLFGAGPSAPKAPAPNWATPVDPTGKGGGK
jgi:hypothetical protein